MFVLRISVDKEYQLRWHISRYGTSADMAHQPIWHISRDGISCDVLTKELVNQMRIVDNVLKAAIVAD